MKLKTPQLFVRINEEGRDFFLPSTLSRPTKLDSIIEANILNFTIPNFALNNTFDTDEDVFGAYQDSLLQIDNFDVIDPHFFQRDVDLKLEGELPRRSIYLPMKRALSRTEFNSIVFSKLRRYSNLAKKWVSNSIPEIEGYELDFKVSNEVSFDTDLDLISYFNSRRIDEAFPYLRVSCGLTYYCRK